MKNIRHFIWDFDGTLLDTYPFTTRCLQLALEDFGYTVDQTVILEKMMVRIPWAIQFYTDLYGLPDLKAHYKKYHAAEADEPCRAFPYVKDVLERIVELGAANYVFTNRNRSVHPMLERAGLHGLFKEIVTSEDAGFVVKPAPDTIMYLMEKYGAKPENTAMVGDRKIDLESAYGAGCKTVHLLTPAVPQYPPCDWRIESFSHMLELLK